MAIWELFQFVQFLNAEGSVQTVKQNKKTSVYITTCIYEFNPKNISINPKRKILFKKSALF